MRPRRHQAPDPRQRQAWRHGHEHWPPRRRRGGGEQPRLGEGAQPATFCGLGLPRQLPPRVLELDVERDAALAVQGGVPRLTQSPKLHTTHPGCDFYSTLHTALLLVFALVYDS